MAKPNRKPNRKPMDKLNGYDSREAMWEAIRKKKEFTVRDLYLETTLKVDSVREYVTGLFNAGYLEKKDSGKKVVIYRLVKDAGVDAPRVRKDGTKVTQGQGRINMWRTMRMVGTFTAKELVVNASTPDCIIREATAADYCRHLCLAGYLQRRGTCYIFNKPSYTGPKPPMIQRVKRVWDQNLKKVMWREDGGRQ